MLLIGTEIIKEGEYIETKCRATIFCLITYAKCVITANLS